jgi:hypothetical protein
MAQPIKYNTGSKTTGCCIRKGNYDIGVVENYQYGPTAGSGFWAGYDIPVGGFVSYQNKASQGPSIYEIPTVDALVDFGLNLNIGSTNDTANEVIEACSDINTIALVNINYPELPQIDNLLLNLDAGYTASYPWMGTNWYSVAGGTVTQGILSGGTAWFSGSSSVNYSDSYLNMERAGGGGQFADCPAFGSALQEFTVNVWAYIEEESVYSAENTIVGQRTKGQGNCNFAIIGNGTTGFKSTIILGGTNYSVDFGAIASGSWYMFTLTFNDTNELKGYVDGTQRGGVVSGPSGALVSNGFNTIIGGNAGGVSASGTDTFNGRINVVNIYNTALSDGEITSLYNGYNNQRTFK